jgi:TonB family protein
MKRFPVIRNPFASAAAASLALHAAVVLAVVLWAADSNPRLIGGDGGGILSVSLVDDAAGHGQKRDDRDAAGIPARTAKPSMARQEEGRPEKPTNAVEPAQREVPSIGDARTDLAVFSDGAVPARSGKAEGGVAIVPASAGTGGGTDGAGGQVSGATPRYRDNPRPDYPRTARLKGYEGLVLVEAVVGADGKVGDVRLKISSGYAVLDRSALAAVRDWKFEPGRRMGIPVAMRVDVPVRFMLRE